MLAFVARRPNAPLETPLATLYTLFKFIHVTAVIVWIGGVVVLSFLEARLARTGDRDGLSALSRHGRFIGQRIVGPSSMLTLLAGIVMMIVARLGFPFWIVWGFVVMFATGALGGGVLRRLSIELETKMDEVGLESPAVQALRQRMSRLSALTMVLILSAIWVMVFKTTL